MYVQLHLSTCCLLVARVWRAACFSCTLRPPHVWLAHGCNMCRNDRSIVLVLETYGKFIGLALHGQTLRATRHNVLSGGVVQLVKVPALETCGRWPHRLFQCQACLIHMRSTRFTPLSSSCPPCRRQRAGGWLLRLRGPRCVGLSRILQPPRAGQLRPYTGAPSRCGAIGSSSSKGTAAVSCNPRRSSSETQQQ